MTRTRRPKRSRNFLIRLLAFFHIKPTSHTLWTTAFILFGIAIISFYGLFLSPYATLWRGLFGDLIYPDGYTIRGIDISHYQGEIDWDKLKNAKIDKKPVNFIFIKATEGKKMVDKCFDKNFKSSRESGIMRGAYHYFIPTTSALKQAQHFIKNVPLETGDLPPVLDIEITSGLSSRRLQDSALVWLQTIERHYGVKPILYTYRKFREKYLNTPELNKYPYWIAHYYVETLDYKGEWKFWQHTDRGQVDGIKGDVDLNCYNGSMYDLKQLTIDAE